MNAAVGKNVVYSFQTPYVADVGADNIRPKRSGFWVFPVNMRAISAVRLRADDIRPYSGGARERENFVESCLYGNAGDCGDLFQ